MSNNGQTHQKISTVDDSEDDDNDYYDTNDVHPISDENDNAMIEMEMMKAVSSQ